MEHSGISGVHSFLGGNSTTTVRTKLYISDEPAAPEALGASQNHCKGIQDIEEFSFNTTVSFFMIW